LTAVHDVTNDYLMTKDFGTS